MDNAPDPDAKVLFRIPRNDGTEDFDVETLWARALGDDRFKLDNCPFFAYSVSWQDVVHAPFDEAEGFPTFRDVIEKSGNRTIRLVVNPCDGDEHSTNILSALVRLGCSSEGANSRYVVINIPSAIDFGVVVRFLIEAKAKFEYADPTYAELFPGR